MTIALLFGLIGGTCFAWCGVPVALATWRAGKSVGTPVSVALLILTGGLSMFAYLLLSYGLDWLLAGNYLVEVASWAVVAWYHFLPRRRTVTP